MTDETDAQLLPLPQYLREPPNGYADQPVAGERLLPFQRLTAADFERLCLAAAERVDGLDDPRLYGKPGQRQHGIDLFGGTANGYSDYQVRRVEAELTPTALRETVEDFAEGIRPFDAKRFVLCHAATIRRTQTLDELAKLRLELPDLVLDLWDGERLTRVLREAPNLVELYFNEHWRTVLYGPPPAPAGPSSVALQPLTVDALARGPLRVLGLEADLAAADAASDPVDRAGRLGEIADKLSAHGFDGVAATIARRRIDALVDGHDVGRAVGLLLVEAERLTERGNVAPTPAAVYRLKDLHSDLEPSAEARLEALEAMHRFYSDAGSALDLFATAAGRLADMDGSEASAAMAVVWWAESALACRDEKNLQRAVDAGLPLQESVPSELQTRFRILVAEARGDWDAILRDVATGSLMTVDQGLVYCRHARWLAWHGDGDGARRSYRAAIDPLARASYIRDLTYCIRSEHDVSLLLSQNPSQAEHLLAQVTGLGSRLPSDRNAYSNALEELSREQWPAAHMWTNRFLFESVRLGNLRGEFLARQLLGRIYAQTNESAAAAGNYLLCGQGSDAIAQVGSQIPPMDVAELVVESAPWVRGATLSLIATDADFRTQTEAEALLPAITAGLDAPPVSLVGPRVSVEAFKALAAMALLLPDSEIPQLLQRLEHAIPRPPSQPLLTDGACALCLALLAGYRPGVRAAVHAMMLVALDHDALAEELELALAKTAHEDEAFRTSLMAKSSEGNLFATRALLITEVETAETLTVADNWVRQALSAPPPSPNQINLGGRWGHIAAAARLLSEETCEQVAGHLLAIAESAAYLEIDRAGAVEAAGNLGAHVGASMRSSLFSRAMALTGQPDLNPFDDFARQTSHKLSAFRINLGPGELARGALLASARLGSSDDEVASAYQAVIRLMSSSEEHDARAAASALIALPETVRGGVSIQVLADNPSDDIRGAAAYLFCQVGESSEIGRRLATDAARSVRLTIATNLRSLPAILPELGQIEEILLEDPSAVVRAAARLNARVALGPTPLRQGPDPLPVLEADLRAGGPPIPIDVVGD